MKTEMLPTEIPMTTAGEPFARVTTLAGETYFVDGFEVRRTHTGYGTEVHVRRCGGLGWTRAIAPIAAVELLTPAEYLALFEGRIEGLRPEVRRDLRRTRRGDRANPDRRPLHDLGREAEADRLPAP